MRKSYGEMVLWFLFGVTLGLLVVRPLIAEDRPKETQWHCYQCGCNRCCGPKGASWVTSTSVACEDDTTPYEMLMEDPFTFGNIEDVPPPKCKALVWNGSEYICKEKGQWKE